jgi:hypothetical protein
MQEGEISADELINRAESFEWTKICAWVFEQSQIAFRKHGPDVDSLFFRFCDHFVIWILGRLSLFDFLAMKFQTVRYNPTFDKLFEDSLASLSLSKIEQN